MKRIILNSAICLFFLVLIAGCVSCQKAETFDIAPDDIFSVANTDTENVVYVSDMAKPGGQGTSAQDPLYPTILPDEFIIP